MSDELDALVDDGTKLEPEAEVEAPEPEAAEPEKGELEPAAEPDPAASPAAEPSPASQHVPVAALVAERTRAQEAERELADLKSKLEESQPERPDFVEDPDAAFKHLEDSFEQRLAAERINMSRIAVSTAHDDFADRENEFMELAKANPHLVDQMLASDNPALFAYNTAKQHAEWAAIQDVDKTKAAIRAEVEAEVRAKIEAEMKADGERTATIAKAAGLPSLHTATAASSGAEVPTDDDLSSILDNR